MSEFKFVAFSDIHIHNFKAFDKDNSRLLNCLKCIRYLFQYADKHGIDTIFFCGDLFQQPKTVPTVVLNYAIATFKSIFNGFPNIKLYAISGNHDYASQHTIDKPAITSLYPLKELFKYNFILMDDLNMDITDDISLYGLPYYQFDAEYYGRLELNEKPPKYSILLTHATVIGVEDNFGSIDPYHAHYDKYDLILAGDIHIKKRLKDNFYMLGSPIHKDLGDVGEDKGFWAGSINVVDKTHSMEFISLNDKFPVYRVLDNELDIDKYQKDYITIKPTKLIKNDGDSDNSKFESTLSPKMLIKNYCDFLKVNDAELLDIGLELYSKIEN